LPAQRRHSKNEKVVCMVSATERVATGSRQEWPHAQKHT